MYSLLLKTVVQIGGDISSIVLQIMEKKDKKDIRQCGWLFQPPRKRIDKQGDIGHKANAGLNNAILHRLLSMIVCMDMVVNRASVLLYFFASLCAIKMST